MRITGTFLDEISHDIPHQNWGYSEWDRDFGLMKKIGIEMVILIRCGYRKWLTYPSQVLVQQEGAFNPPSDLVAMFLELSEKHGLDFYFGIYDSGKYWQEEKYDQEVEINKRVIDEVWEKYGHFKAFKGWYLSQEVSRKVGRIIPTYAALGAYCKNVSGNLPVLISPYIEGRKAVLASSSYVYQNQFISLEQHEKDWSEIMAGINQSVDIVAFQDGHVYFEELPDFLELNKKIADLHGLQSWTNSESFDRDMPIKFMPIKWEKLLLKLKAAKTAGFSKAITFEFSHFMSPQSAYLQAGHLYNRYQEYIETYED